MRMGVVERASWLVTAFGELSRRANSRLLPRQVTCNLLPAGDFQGARQGLGRSERQRKDDGMRRTKRLRKHAWFEVLPAIVAVPLALAAWPSEAATIHVGATCSLQDAIEAANTDAPAGGCTAGRGGDTIVLVPRSEIILTEVADDGPDVGPSGLPPITSSIVVAGRGSTISRDPSAPDFRIFNVEGGDLTLVRTRVSGGSALGSGFYRGEGGGVLVQSGSLSLSRCTLDNNYAEFVGAAVSGSFGRMLVEESLLTENVGQEALFLRFGDLTVNRSTFLNNAAIAVFIGASVMTVDNATVSGNDGGLTFTEGGMTIRNSTITGNDWGIFTEAFYIIEISHSIISGNGVNIVSTDPTSVGWILSDHNVFGHSGVAGIEGLLPSATDIVPTVPLRQVIDPVARRLGQFLPVHALPPGSPAIDASPVDANCPMVDQRGVARPQGLACDIGAVERASSRSAY